jgi:arginine decarboxylase
MSERVRTAVTAIPELSLFTREQALARPGVAGFDPTHVTIDVSALGLTGYQAADWLFDNQQISFELMDHRRLMALITYADNEATTGRLGHALQALAAAHRSKQRSEAPPALPASSQLRTETVLLPRQSFLGKTKELPIAEAVGAVSADIVTPYPPGIPAVAPGEIITQPIIDYLQQFVAIGGFIEGATDPKLKTLRVSTEQISSDTAH